MIRKSRELSEGLIKQITRPLVMVSICLILLTQIGYAQQANSINKVSITVSDLEQAVPFYTNVLSFKLMETYTLEGKSIQRLFGIRDENLKIEVASLQLGREQIALMEFHSVEKGRPIPADSKSNDLWFQHIAIVVKDMEKAYAAVAKHKVEHVSTAPQTLPAYIPAAAGISAFYFRDPDDHNIELIYFPKGKGNPKWQLPTDKVFLGIDHSAIGIEETEESLNYYRDILALKVAGNSENYGIEQEHLNQVFGARLQITGLQAQAGFGIEFLDYIAPPGGRPYPKDSSPLDLWHWHTSIQVANAEEVYQKIQENNYPVISSGLIEFDKASPLGTKGFLTRGPDGHAILIYE